MALTSQFIAELTAQAESIESALREMQDTLEAHEAEVGLLRRKRESLLANAVDSLLPDLNPATLDRLDQVLTGIAAPALVQSTIRETREALETQLAAARREYDAGSHEGRVLEVTAALESARSSLEDVQKPYRAMAARTQIGRLVTAQYGKPGYRPRWYHWFMGDAQYFRDWEAADFAVEVAGLPDWDAVEAQYTTRLEAIRTFYEQVQTLSAQEKALTEAKAHYEEVFAALELVEQTVLDRFRTKLRSRLEELDPPPAPVAGIRRMEDQIRELQSESTRLHETRAKLVEQLNNLRRLQAKASQSRRRTVPDDFLDLVRGRSDGPTVIYVEDRRGWDGMDLYFAEQLIERQRQSDSGYRRRTWRDASSDRSGQS